MSVYHMHAWYPWKIEGGTGSSGIGATDGYEPRVGGGTELRFGGSKY